MGQLWQAERLLYHGKLREEIWQAERLPYNL